MEQHAFETLVRRALLEAATHELSAEDGGEAPTLSPRYLVWKKHMLASPFGYARQRARPLWRRGLWIAACLVLAIAVSLGGLMAVSPAARAWARQVFAQWFDDYARFTFPGVTGQETGAWRTGYLPEGFELAEETDLGAMTIVLYKNQDDAKIRLIYSSVSGLSFSTDSEHHTREEITLHGNDGVLLRSYVPGHPSFMIWTEAEHGIAFKLTAEIAPEELILIAENISIAEE